MKYFHFKKWHNLDQTQDSIVRIPVINLLKYRKQQTEKATNENEIIEITFSNLDGIYTFFAVLKKCLLFLSSLSFYNTKQKMKCSRYWILKVSCKSSVNKKTIK